METVRSEPPHHLFDIGRNEIKGLAIAPFKVIDGKPATQLDTLGATAKAISEINPASPLTRPLLKVVWRPVHRPPRSDALKQGMGITRCLSERDRLIG